MKKQIKEIAYIAYYYDFSQKVIFNKFFRNKKEVNKFLKDYQGWKIVKMTPYFSKSKIIN